MTDPRKVIQFQDLSPTDPLGSTTAATRAQPSAGSGHGLGAVSHRAAERTARNISRAAQDIIEAADNVMRAAEHAARRQATGLRATDPERQDRPPAATKPSGSGGNHEPRIRIDPGLRAGDGIVKPDVAVRPQRHGRQPGLADRDLVISAGNHDVQRPRIDTFSLPEPRPQPRRRAGAGLAVLFPVLAFAAFIAMLSMGSGKHQDPSTGEARRQTAGLFVGPPDLASPASTEGASSGRSLGPQVIAGAAVPEPRNSSAVASAMPAADTPPASSSSAPGSGTPASVATSAAPSAAAVAPAVAACLASRPAKLQLSADKIARLLTSGRTYMAAGQIPEARVMFRRAADACDPYAAFALGTTYDPTFRQKVGSRVRPFAEDLATARAWYEKAKKLGSAEASDQLEFLATLGNPVPVARTVGNSAGFAAGSGTAPAASNVTVSRRHHQNAPHSDTGLIPWLDLFGRF